MMSSSGCLARASRISDAPAPPESDFNSCSHPRRCTFSPSHASDSAADSICIMLSASARRSASSLCPRAVRLQALRPATRRDFHASSVRPRPHLDTVSRTSQRFLRQRRRFSATAAAQHGHIDPPKPGEECVSACTRVTIEEKD